MSIKCCRYCVAPKRHPGCHDRCAEYQGEKTAYNELKAAADKKKAIESGLDSQFAKSVRRSAKISRKKG